MDITQRLGLLSAQELLQLETTGYIVVKKILPSSYIERTIQATWNYLGMDPRQPDT